MSNQNRKVEKKEPEVKAESKPAIVPKRSVKAPTIRGHEFKVNKWFVEIPPEHEAADLLKAEYWANSAQKLKYGDRVEALAANGEWLVEMFVRFADKVSAEMVILHEHDLTKGAKEHAFDLSEFTVEFRATDGWSVIRKSDGAIMTQGHDARHKAIEAFGKGMGKNNDRPAQAV